MAPNRRQVINQQIRQQNARARKAAKQQFRRAKGAYADATTPPNYISNENLQRRLSDNQNRLNQTQAGLDDQERQLGVSYGVGQYGGDIASNPYSRAALLQRSYNQNQRATTNTLASRGQLYAGSASNAFTANRANFAQAQDGLQREYAARLGQIQTRRQDAANTFSDANEVANRDAVNEASKLFPSNRDIVPRKPTWRDYKPTIKPLRPPIQRPKSKGRR